MERFRPIWCCHEGAGRARLNALRMIKAALQKHQVDSMTPLDEAASSRS